MITNDMTFNLFFFQCQQNVFNLPISSSTYLLTIYLLKVIIYPLKFLFINPFFLGIHLIVLYTRFISFDLVAFFSFSYL
jgi:hypothetical protein